MESILTLEDRLNDFFKVKELDKDPGFSKFIPMVYDPIEFDWKSFFEKDFTTRDWGRGFLPISNDQLYQIKDKGLSIYTCHAPLDYNLFHTGMDLLD